MKSTIRNLLLLFVAFGVLSMCAAGFVHWFKREAMKLRLYDCISNVKLITLAMDEYHTDFGSYPPAYTTDEHGRRLHSWRVLLLPYLGHNDLYEELALDEPWNTPRNQRVGSRAPYCYKCPSCSGKQCESTTAYVVVTGEGTTFDEGRCAKASSFELRPLLVVEHQGGTHWMAPNDIPIEAAIQNLESNHPDVLTYNIVVGGQRGAGSNSQIPERAAYIIRREHLSVEELRELDAGAAEIQQSLDHMPPEMQRLYK